MIQTTTTEAVPPALASARISVDTYRNARQLPEDVLALMRSRMEASLQFSPDWMLNLEQTVFPGHAGICYFTLRENGVPVALLPTIDDSKGFGARVRALGNYYTALFEPAIRPGTKPEALVPLLQALRKHHAPVHSLTLSPMDPDGEAYRTLEQALRLAGFAPFRYFCFGNWYLKAPKDWPAYLASLDSKQRSTIKRMNQRIKTDDGSVEIICGEQDLARGLAAYQAVYEKSWKVPEPSQDFVPGLMQMCMKHNALRLGVVWMKGQAIAAQLWIVHGRRAEIYKVAYDENFKAYSPGTVLTAGLIQHVLEQDGVTEIDYLIGDDSYKKNWMSDRRERWGLVAYDRRSLAGLIGATIEVSRRTARPWVKRWKALLQRRTEPAQSSKAP